ncbi:ATP synthase protein MI25 [Triticum aestivum]|uniref:ATP synthase protein MI25 n=1 Tax=Triticum aestivum TaxID=4565 RepID=UPI001D0025C8|nr:ATP synthase protein MI25-like [Triticum aestivum]
MRFLSTDMKDRNMLFAAIPSICASCPKKISIYNEEMIVARCFIGFLIFSRKSLGKTFKETLDGRIESIQEELLQFFNPNEVIPEESNEQQRLLRISLRICSTVVESLPTARCAPKCEKTVQALLCRNLNVKSATLLNATSSRRIRLQDDIVTGFHFSVSERFVSGSTFKASTIDLIREGLIVLRKVRVGVLFRKNKKNLIHVFMLTEERMSVYIGVVEDSVLLAKNISILAFS